MIQSALQPQANVSEITGAWIYKHFCDDTIRNSIHVRPERKYGIHTSPDGEREAFIAAEVKEKKHQNVVAKTETSS